MNDISAKELGRLLELKKKKSSRFSKFIVSLVILLNIFFTVAILYLFRETGSEPIALIGAWFAFTTVELWSLSKIKRDEIKEMQNEY